MSTAQKPVLRHHRTWATVAAVALALAGCAEAANSTLGPPPATSAPPVTPTTAAPTTPGTPTTPATTPTTPGAPTRRVPTVTDPLRLRIVGDSIIQAAGLSLIEDATTLPRLKPTLDFRFSSGLTRRDFFNWQDYLHGLLGKPKPPEAVVVMMGANDAQGINTSEGPQQFGTPEWREEYGRRVAALMDMLTAHHVAVYWIGQPRMVPKAYSARMSILDDIYQAQARTRVKQGVRFLDTRPMSFPRLADGIHMTLEGGRTLAGAILAMIEQDWRITSHPTSPTKPTATAASSPKATTVSPSTASPQTKPEAATLPATLPNKYVYAAGDSVLLGVQYSNTLGYYLRGWRVHYDCVGSRRLVQFISVLRSKTWRAGDTVVIMLGTNYIVGEDGSYASQITSAMYALRKVRRVVWVTVAEYFYGHYWPSRTTINRAIRAAALRYSKVRVADWAPIVRAHPSYTYDGLHLTSSGRYALGKLIAGKVKGS